MSIYKNPFPEADTARHAIWDMLVARDIEAFVQHDWSIVANDFIEATFMGLDARGSDNPDSWQLTFPTLASYRDSWLAGATKDTQAHQPDKLRQQVYNNTFLRDIDVQNDRAIAHKKFDGILVDDNSNTTVMQWQTLYQCQKVDGQWKISGFVGYLPFPMGQRRTPEPQLTGKRVPTGAGQHSTAGPYSPVLQVKADKIVVISGQVALDIDGNVVGGTIEEQTAVTLENCAKQLATGSCSLADVFKVNVFITDLDNWGRFNVVYAQMMPEPRPVRTAVQTPLLPGLLVEVEMWATSRGAS